MTSKVVSPEGLVISRLNQKKQISLWNKTIHVRMQVYKPEYL
jgi:hypothetical protein